jgi:chaperonin GroEL (HSP60 family)
VGFIQRPAFPRVDALLKRKTVRYHADSRSINIKVIRAVCEVANGAIGPYAMNKLLSGTGIVTSDGLTLVKEMRFRMDQPVVNLLLRALEVQDREAGDGSTRMLLLVGGLLDEAERLMEKHVHPSRISQWFGEAASEATDFLAGMAKRAEGFEDLLGVAATASAGMLLAEARQGLVSEIVKGVRIVTEARGCRKVVDREALSIEIVDSGNAADSFLLRGCLVWGGRAHPEMPKTVKNPKVAIVDFPLDCFNKPAYASRIPLCRVELIAHIGGLQEIEKERVKLLGEMIDAIAKSHADVVVCKRGIGDIGISMLARRGLFAMERVMREVEILRLSKTTGAKIIADPINITSSDLGTASLVEEREFAGKHAVFFENRRNARAATLVIFGVNAACASVNKRSAETAVGAVTSVVECSRVVPGGGGAEAAVSRFLRSRALKFSSKKQLVYESFATALMVIPTQIAKSTGTDTIRLVSDLIRCHETGDSFGIDATNKGIADMYKRRIVDPLRVASCAIRNASDFACQLLDVDLTLKEPRDAPKEAEEQRAGHRA